MTRRKHPAPADIEACASAWSLDKQVHQARRDMGEARWAKLNRAWEQDPIEQET